MAEKFKNQYATFAMENNKLSISLTKGKVDYRVRFTTRTKDGKSDESQPEYFDPNEKGLEAAQKKFSDLCAGAEKKGWKQVAKTNRGKTRMTEIPTPGEVTKAAEAAKKDDKKK